ncbi:MAG: integrin alpha, partial [Primorskyibacter sp.]
VSAAGDVNGDGFDDLIVGAPRNDDAGSNAGAAYVIFGGATPGDIDLSAIPSGAGITILGRAAGDLAGFSVSGAGDINGDGLDDLIIGANESNADGTESGEAYVLYGKTDLADIDLANIDASDGFFIQGDVAGDNAGHSVSGAGDLNGDGFDDLIVGALDGDDGGTNTGEAYVIYGGAFVSDTVASKNVAGTASADNFAGAAGHDTFTDISTDDVVRGGAGDDAITLTSLDFADVDGGHGTDSLILDGAGLDLDLTGTRTDVEHFELIDLSGSGANSLTIDRLTVEDLSNRTANGITTFTVGGDADDMVHLSDGGWTQNGQRTENGTVYDVYEQGNAEVLIEDPVTVDMGVS